MATPPNVNKVRRYEQWRTGQLDRLNDKPCCSPNGDYLDGWYNPHPLVPDFLTVNEVCELKRYFDRAYVRQLEQYDKD
jgi:hypothetical protein